MRPSAGTRLCCALSAVLAALLLGWPAISDEIPEKVGYELEHYRKMCVEAGGTPGTLEAAIVRHDVDGDGELDWILDSRKLACPGARASYGKATLLAIFLRHEGNWYRSLLQAVLDWEVGFARGLPSLKLKQTGDWCVPERKKPCWMTFVFERGRGMRHIRTQ
jgi:hypothetical protein